MSSQSSSSWERALFVGAWLTWLACCAIRSLSGAPLGHDEARYAIAGRDLLSGDDSRWTYVPPGMEVIAMPGIWAGGDERALRVLPVLLSCAFLAVAWFVARRLATKTAGAIAIGLLATMTQLVRVAADLLSDVPSAGLLLIAAFVVFTELTRASGPTFRLCWAAPACALAMYIRYGSCIPIAIFAAVALAGCARALLLRPLPVVATVGLFVALMLPHAVHAIMTTGSPLGTLLVSSTVPVGFGKGLSTYLAHPVEMFGIPVLAMVPFAIASAWRSRRNALLLVSAVAVVCALGIKTYAEPRYVFFSSAMFVVLGAGELARWIEARARRTRIILVVALSAVLALAWIWQVVVSPYYRSTRLRVMQPTLLAARVIRDANVRAPCFVLGRHTTQLEWYGGCTAIFILTPYPDGPVFAVRDNTGGPWQPDLASLPGRQVSLLHGPGLVEVVRLLP